MKKYLSTLYRQPARHKKRVAFMASSAITLFIFGAWSLATFSINEKIVAKENEISPLESFRANLASSIEAFQNSFEGLGSGLKAVDFESEYKKLRDGALDTYGR